MRELGFLSFVDVYEAFLNKEVLISKSFKNSEVTEIVIIDFCEIDCETVLEFIDVEYTIKCIKSNKIKVYGGFNYYDEYKEGKNILKLKRREEKIKKIIKRVYEI